jgi:hypothetical protein
MATSPVAPLPAPADDGIVYESMHCIRIYKNHVEHYFGSEFIAASMDAAATDVASGTSSSPPTSLHASTSCALRTGHMR